MPAKKKAIKKKASKPPFPLPVPLTGASVGIKILCAPTCTARPKHPHTNLGDVVTFMAVQTGATLDFYPGSPFQSGHTHIVLAANTAQSETINNAPGEYFYNLTCTKCATAVNDPSIIID